MGLLLKILVALLVFFTPFSFAATEPWAFSVVQGILILAWTVVLLSRREIFYPSLFKRVFVVFFILISLALVQSLFPQTLLQPVPWHPITLIRLYTLEHASLFVTYLALVLLIIQVYPSFKEVKQLIWTLILAAAAVEICELLSPDGQYITFLTGVKAGPGSVGPFLNRNHAGMFFVMNALLALGLFFTHQLQLHKSITREQRFNFVVQQICLALLSLGLMTSAVFTRSRGAMLSLLVGLFCYAFLCIWAIPAKLRKRVKGFFYTLVLLILSAAWIYTYVDDINAFAHRQTNGPSEQTRQMFYRSAQRMLDQYPWWGIGIGALPVAITQYTEWNISQYIERLHNDWLEILLGIGYMGAALLAPALLWFAIKILRRLKHLETRKQFLFAALLSALTAMCVGSLVDFHFFIPGCALVFFIILGLTNAPSFHKSQVHSLHLPWIACLALLGILLTAGYIPLQKTRCWRAFVFGHPLKTESKLAYYEKGLPLYPSPRYAVRLANGYYNASLHTTDPLIRLFYQEQAYYLTTDYLEKYPKDKAFSRLYNRLTRPSN